MTSVWLAGLFFTPGLRLSHERLLTLRELLAGAAQRVDVRVLAWAGAPLPLFHPDRKEVRAMRRRARRAARGCGSRSTRGSGRCTATTRSSSIVDGEVAFVGGIDLTTYAGDRLDSSEHPARGSIGWHDAAARIRGPGGRRRRRPLPAPLGGGDGRAAARSAAAARPPGTVELQVVRTVPERIYERLPRGEFGILESYLRGLRARAAADLPREPVPLVARDRRRARREAPAAARRPLPARRAAPGEAEQRQR